MAKILLIAPETLGHLNPSIAILKRLQIKGHHVSMMGRPDGEDHVRSQGIDYHIVGEKEFPKGTIQDRLNDLGEKKGKYGFRVTRQFYIDTASVYLAQLPAAVNNIKPDLLILDQTYRDAAAVADVLDIPYVTLCNALNLIPDVCVPPAIFDWDYSPSLFAKWRNIFGYCCYVKSLFPILLAVDHYRKKNGLARFRGPLGGNSKHLILTQLTNQFEFPRKKNKQLYNLGPIIDDSVQEDLDTFPFEKITGREFAYVSMGSIQNRQSKVFKVIAEACHRCNILAVITTGHGCSLNSGELAGEPVVVAYAPQTTLLKKATILITHAGMNTTMGGLKNGLPIVAIPITNEQFGIAARIKYSGTGLVLKLENLSPEKLEKSIWAILHNPKYRNKAVNFQQEIKSAGGAVRAAELIQKLIAKLGIDTSPPRGTPR